MDVGYGGDYDHDGEMLDESQIVDQLTQELSRNLLEPSTSLPVPSTEDNLLRCRLERFEDEEIRKLEEDRLQEIIRLCQSYNESQEGKRVRSLRVNEVDHLLELMKKPEVMQMAKSPTSPAESNRLVTSIIETSNAGNGFNTVDMPHPSVKDVAQMINNQSNQQVNTCKRIENSDLCNDYDQVENDSEYDTNDAKSPESDDKLTALSLEKSLIRNEIDDMKQQQFSDAEDEELKEFQRIEKEIKLNELYKCLETIEKEIITIKHHQLKQRNPPSTLRASSTHQEVHQNQRKYESSGNAIGGEEETYIGSGSGSGSGKSSREAPLASCESDESSSSDEDISLGEKVKSADFSHLVQHHQQHMDNYHTYSTIYSPTNSETPSDFHSSPNSPAYNPGNMNQPEIAESVLRLRREGRTSSEEVDSMKERQQRPLTIYLPSITNDLDLIDHIVNLGHDVGTFSHLIQLTPSSCAGYLWKLCSNTENQWRKRYFLFDRQNKVFVYFKSFSGFVKAKKAKYGVYFNQIEDAYVDHNRTKLEKKSNPLSGSLRRRNNSTRHVFVIVTSERNFTLSSFVPEVMRIWIDVIFTGAEGYLSFEP